MGRCARRALGGAGGRRLPEAPASEPAASAACDRPPPGPNPGAAASGRLGNPDCPAQVRRAASSVHEAPPVVDPVVGSPSRDSPAAGRRGRACWAQDRSRRGNRGRSVTSANQRPSLRTFPRREAPGDALERRGGPPRGFGSASFPIIPQPPNSDLGAPGGWFWGRATLARLGGTRGKNTPPGLMNFNEQRPRSSPRP